jgi:hypothetical protein
MKNKNNVSVELTDYVKDVDDQRFSFLAQPEASECQGCGAACETNCTCAYYVNYIVPNSAISAAGGIIGAIAGS